MALIKPPEPVNYIAGLLLASEDLLEPVCQALEPVLGSVDQVTALLPFGYTDYYEAEMGAVLRTYLAFKRERSPEELASIKIATCELENHWRAGNGGRRVNIDPGYLSSSQLVLASTKAFSHRIYLSQGIYAEVTLLFMQGSFQPLPWTYPDYKANIPLFNQWKIHFRKQKSKTGGES